MHQEDQLIQALKNNPSKAIEIIYSNYYPSLYGTILHIVKDLDDSKDVFQDAMISVWKKSHTYDKEKATPYTWLYNVVKRKAIDFVRSKGRRIMITNDDLESHNELFKTCEMNIDMIDFEEHLDSLKPMNKLVLQYSLAGFSQRETSVALDMPLGTVKSKTEIAKRELKNIYLNVRRKKTRRGKRPRYSKDTGARITQNA